MVTGPHSFKDPTGVEWHIRGYSTVCGSAYVDCWTADGKAVTVRPVGYLAPAGLSIPDDAPPPKRASTTTEKKSAKTETERLLAGQTYAGALPRHGKVEALKDAERIARERIVAAGGVSRYVS